MNSSVIKNTIVKESVRRQALPVWIDNLWHDLRRTGQVKVVVNLGQKCLHIAGSGLKPASSGDISGARRAELDEEKAKHNPGHLPGEFWRRLGLPLRLPAHLRPRGDRR